MDREPSQGEFERVDESARRKRRSIERWRHRKIVATVVGSSLAVTVFVLWMSAPGRSPLATIDSARPASGAEAQLSPVTETRPVYRHSVVPGGVFSRAEVISAIRRDPVVAAHYAKVNTAALRVEYLREPRWAHVSYRVGDNVYWTRAKVKLNAGEQILTDGQTTIRARCGNCVSGDALAPAAQNEPSPEEFDTLGDPAVIVARVETDPQPGLMGPNPSAPFGGGDPSTTANPRFDPTRPPVIILGVPTTRPSGDPSGGPGTSPGPGPGPGGPTADPNPPGPNPPGPNPPGPNPPGPNPPGPNPPGPNPPGPNPPGPNPPGPNPPGPNPPGPNPPGPNPPGPNPPGPEPPDPGAPLPVPEPATLVLVGIGAAAGLARHLRNRRSRPN